MNNNSPILSIVIPTYEMHGRGLEFLAHSFEQLGAQGFQDFEIVVSDHSKNDEIKAFCTTWQNTHGFRIRHYKNTRKRGNSSANLNDALRHARGSLIKILFQDDYLHSPRSLETIVEHFQANPTKRWLATGSCQYRYPSGIETQMTPRYNDEIHLGKNTISSPSVVALRNNARIPFDEELLWLMDVEYYKRLHDTFGEPILVEDICTVNRLWKKQLSKRLSFWRKRRERRYTAKKHPENTTLDTSADTSDIERHFNRLCNADFEQEYCLRRGMVDIHEHLPTIRRYAEQCEHVTEFGVRFAVSTQALLIARPSILVAYDLNSHYFAPYRAEIEQFAKLCKTPFHFIEADVLQIDIAETDLLLIDTFHTYQQLRKELQRHAASVRKWIILHDTETYGYCDEAVYTSGSVSELGVAEQNTAAAKVGLQPALLEFLSENPQWAIREHFSNNNGLTILERKNQHLP